MSVYRDYPPSTPRLIGYDPHTDVPQKHLARLVDRVVDATVEPAVRTIGRGQPPFDPRLVLKVLLYAYCIGVRSSRQMERLCQESLPFLFLTRGDTPSYGTLCYARLSCKDEIEHIWVALLTTAKEMGVARLGRVVVDSTKLRANASPEAVVKAHEYEPLLAELERIVSESTAVDAREDSEGGSTAAVLPVSPSTALSTDQMRDIIRRVRGEMAEKKRQEKAAAIAEHPAEKVSTAVPVLSEGEEPASRAAPLTPEMVRQATRAIDAIQAAKEEGRKHLCLTDPDARMLGEGRSKGLKECHSFEVAMDNGLIVASGITTEQDNFRLKPLLEAAGKNEPEGIQSVDGDSGYFRGDDIAAIEASGIDTCVPDSHTASDLKRGHPIGTSRSGLSGSVPFTYDADTNRYGCPQGNTLIQVQKRLAQGQVVRIYRAAQPCDICPRAAECLTNQGAKYRQLSVGVHSDVIKATQQRFNNPERQKRYHHRAPAVETTFGFLRANLGYNSWLLRGTVRVACEASLITAAYQVRKLQSALCRRHDAGRRQSTVSSSASILPPTQIALQI